MRGYRLRCGASLVELLVAIAVAGVFLPALATGLVASRNGKVQEAQRLSAVALVKEAEEATRNVREKGWVAFAVNGTYHPEISGSSWSLAANSEPIGQFTRSVVISDACRDATGKIVICPSGSVDPSTKKVAISVSWSSPLPSSVAANLYMTRYLDNLSYEETRKVADFDYGTTTNVKTQLSSGSFPDDGEIVLSQTGGYGDWCEPALTFVDLDLPKSGVANAVSAIQGQAAAGTGDNSSGVSYANVKITDPAYPTAPVASIDGTFDGYKTNGVFTEQNFAYLATDNNGKEIVIMDLTDQNNGKYAEEGYFDAPGNGDGDSIYVLNDIGYMASGNKFYTFDLRPNSHCSGDPPSSSGRGGCRPRLNSSAGLSLAGTGVKMIVVGTNAYLATSGTTNQLQIINVSNPANPTISTSISVPGQGGRDVFVNVPQNRAYLVTAQSAAQAEFFLINLQSNSVIGSYDTQNQGNMDPKGVVAASGGRVILVGIGGKEYQVLNVTNESSPAYCGGLDINSGVNGISTVFTAAERAYSYIITGDSTAEFKIIEGGPGAGNGSYVPSGTFISAPYGPTTLQTAFNRFVANVEQPVANDVQIQLAIADAVAGSCTAGVNYTYVGTDSGGTGSGNYFVTSQTGSASISGAIPLGAISPSYQNPGRCLRYKVILNTTDSTLTPIFKDINVNYSP